MNNYTEKDLAILVVGEGKLAYSVVSCMLSAGHTVTWLTHNRKGLVDDITANLQDLTNEDVQPNLLSKLVVMEKRPEHLDVELAIVVTEEQIDKKSHIIRQLEDSIAEETIVAVNLESMMLEQLQQGTQNPERIIGLNWTYPAHMTFFLEIIGNQVVKPEYLKDVKRYAENHWSKEPYVSTVGFSIRARMFAAMVREAFYLVGNGYASVESVDRACRNDAGYYLPFVGNFRYMDLMGTYAYGIVMKDLNPELSKAMELPKFVVDILANESNGTPTGKGFYKLTDREVEKWEMTFRKFSREIRELMCNYPHDKDTFNS